MELRDQLQSALGSAYTLGPELGGGGMSRVFVADDTSLGRRVVVKVLPPDLAAGVSVERFKREIQLAARLQHPHVVPVLSAGESGGLPYYTMPLVEGESLRERLARGALRVTEAVGVLRDVAKALAYAHERGVVHRDIKPDNVLLTGGSAAVADFGIAKAISAARTGGDSGHGATLTHAGVSLGTPAYMAPEQAAGDPSTDHRADIYGFGCMAYEILAGRPPFTASSLQRLLAAHMGERPEPVTRFRADVPPLLAELVMRCLEKNADARPQGAAELVRVLETVTTSGGDHAAMPGVLLGGRGMLPRALALYGAAFVLVVVLAKAAIVGVGLPDWVFPGAILVMLLGLPVILFTAFVHRETHRALTSTPAVTPGGTPVPRSTLTTLAVKASPHVSWRRTAIGGLVAVGALVLATAAFMALRALGIGPAGSLMAAGVLGERERVIVADFESPPSDATLGPVVAEALRTDLGQSRNLALVPANMVRDVLRRMQRPADSRLEFALAREIATREGLRAVVDGEVVALGGRYVISARLVAAQTGDELAAFRETADDANAIIPAIGRLSRQLRARVGESLRTVQRTPALERVSTSSLEALRKYVQGSRAIASQGDFERGVALLEEAIAIDTGFAMAYRRLAAEISNRGNQTARAIALIQKAYDHRDRLADSERYLTTGSYFWRGPKPNAARAIAAFEAAIEVDSLNAPALNNAAALYSAERQFEKAERYLRRAIALSSATRAPLSSAYFTNLASVQLAQGRVAEAQATVDSFARALPRHPLVAPMQVTMAALRRQYDSADALARAIPTNSPSAGAREIAANTRATMARMRGRLAEARRWSVEESENARASGSLVAPYRVALTEGVERVWFRGDSAGAVRKADSVVADTGWARVEPIDRPFVGIARLYSLAGRPERVRAILAEFERSRASMARMDDPVERAAMLGYVAIAERRYRDAVREFQRGDLGGCVTCGLPDVARAYDLAGDADSAIAVAERYLGRHDDERFFFDSFVLAGIHKRLGELYEERGDRQRAASHYAAFVELWKNADPELQPFVRDVRQRLARLSDPERRQATPITR